MSSNMVSWKEVIRRRYIKENDMKKSRAEVIRTETVTEDEYLTTDGEEDIDCDQPGDDGDGGGSGYIGHIGHVGHRGYGGNIGHNAYPYPGMNQMIECQVLPSFISYHK